ncbi:PASTA domain, binds beta-lactams [Cnuella takakiae]|uniref:PASTA domain, binds beta-lactams n=1 Tax=Cnuella takakiae TaxID=1302690 RepID=A0A1M4VKB2_9BACT|nr:PASTA domain-containing protein [Cnuella takakiae]OLY92572.1 penicillin-binding protein [Cnuella takakiae]SHE69345.1 PASTA domain, binds beta-lactams [Cnuella takakiae]
MFKFITRQSLIVNILAGLVFLFLLGFLFVESLNWLTHHGEAKTVPAVVNKNIAEVQKTLESQGFEVVIQDSIYNEELQPGTVIKQVPAPDDVVKVNRTVYVTVNRSIPPEIEMPNLKGYSFRNAEMVLKNMGLKMGDTTYKPDFAKNSVLDQLFNGKTIPAGTKIRMGSTISLVIGSGVGNTDLTVPTLVGLTYDEANILLQAQGIVLGSVLANPDVQDSAAAFIYRQSPAPKTEAGFPLRIRPGQMIDVWLSVEKPVTDSAALTQPVTEQEPLQ